MKLTGKPKSAKGIKKLKFNVETAYKYSIGIYGIKNIKTGFVYVGQTRNSFWARYRAHKTGLKHDKAVNSLLRSDYKKYGEENFEFYIIEVCEDYRGLDEKEVFYVKKYKELNRSYNISDGGSFLEGRHLSEETRRKMRESSRHLSPTEEHKRILSEYMSNRTVSEETRKKLADINTGEKSPVAVFSNDDVVSIKKMILNGVLLKDIVDIYGCSYGAVSAIATGRSWNHISVDGWDEYIKSRKHKHIFTPDEVKMARELYEKIGNQSEVARIMGCCSSKISSIITGKTHRNV